MYKCPSLLLSNLFAFSRCSEERRASDNPPHRHRLHNASVPIMAGSDFSDWGTVPGIDLHNELALLVEAGFTPLEAMQAATLNPAKFSGKTESFGTIQVGRTADLVVLDANPLEDISHTRKLNAVVLGGKYYPLASINPQALLNASQRQ